MAKRGRKKKRRLSLPSLGLKKSTLQTIFFVFLLGLSAFSIISFLQTGPIPTDYNLILQALFGFWSVLVPFLILIIAFATASIESPFKEPNVLFGFLLMYISLLSLFRQGIVGSFFWNELDYMFTTAPTFLIYIFTLIVGFVVLFDTSVAQILKWTKQLIFWIKKYTLGLSVGKKKKRELPDSLFAQDETASVKEKSSDSDLAVAGVKPILAPASPQIIMPKPLESSPSAVWQYPPITIFDDPTGIKADRGDVRKNATTIEQTLESFGITARVKEVNNSPSVTQYALEVALGTKLAKVVSLSNDLAMALAAPGGQIRVEAPIPGRALVGIEVPNKSLEMVPIRRIMESSAMRDSKSKLSVPLGLDVAGNAKVATIAKMPHVLIAGQTGSGKSVCVNSWLCSLLFRASPEELRLIMVDPKRVELTPYNGIPHLLNPVIVEPDKVVSALKWAVSEMERRYQVFTEVGAKNIESYNDMAGFQSMPYIVIVIDELAEIMLFSPSEVEDNICRIAQMARAVGIHLVLATQRPSVNIITGLIKANIPTRIAFAVASMTDSRVILDTPGAEKLLGKGDMLYIPPDLAKPVRVQGCFISDSEIGRLIDYLKSQKTADYNNDIISQPIKSQNTQSANIVTVNGEDRDEVFNQAVELIGRTGKASASLFQRHLKLGYARAARLLDQLEKAGIVGPGKGAKPRDILIPHAAPSDEVE